MLNVSNDEDSDIAAVAKGCVSITPICLDMTDHSLLPLVKSWAGTVSKKVRQDKE